MVSVIFSWSSQGSLEVVEQTIKVKWKSTTLNFGIIREKHKAAKEKGGRLLKYMKE